MPSDQGKPLRCELCGEQIGVVLIGDPPEPSPNVILRCYQCMAAEAAEAITREAARP